MNEAEITLEKLYQFYNVSSVNDLALKINISRQTITNWKARNSINAIKKKCRELNIYNEIFENITIPKQDDNINQTNHPLLNFQSEFKKLEQLVTMGKGLEDLKIKLDNLKEELKKDI